MRKVMLVAVAVLGILALFAVGASANANLVVNGDFELPAIPHGTWTVFPDGAVPGWTIDYSFPTGNEYPRWLEFQHDVPGLGSAYEGHQYVELDGYDPTKIIQTVASTTQGCSYTLSYAWRPRPNVSVNDMAVYVDDVEVARHSGAGGSTTSWTLSTYDFQAAPDPTTIAFAELGPDDQLGMFLDAVSLVELPCVLAVDIDIKPQSIPNCFNNNSHGVIPVAILGNVRWIDLEGLSFGGLSVRVKGKGNPQCSIEDVSGDFINYPQGGPDGYDDLVCQFVDDAAFAWDQGTGYAQVTGNLLPGYPGTEITIEGSDLICLRPE